MFREIIALRSKKVWETVDKTDFFIALGSLNILMSIISFQESHVPFGIFQNENTIIHLLTTCFSKYLENLEYETLL